MGLTWMRHPEHGIADVYDDATVERNKAAGWEVFDRAAEKAARLAAARQAAERAPEAPTGADAPGAGDRAAEAVPPVPASTPYASALEEERQALIAQAEAAGLRVDRRWGILKLRAALKRGGK